MSSRTTRSQTNSQMLHTFGEQFKAFAPKAWDSYDGEDTSAWARAQARVFWHTENNTIPFRVVYTSLLRFANMVIELEEKETEEDSTLERDARLVNAIVPEGQQTAAEERLARNELNRILFREYNNWYEAFEAEAAEDLVENLSAEDRFSRHCAKILSRRTGLRSDLLETIVGGWLEQHNGRA